MIHIGVYGTGRPRQAARNGGKSAATGAGHGIAPPAPLALSIVLPLDDDRGHGAGSLESWVRQTTTACFEIVAVADRRAPAQVLAGHARALLRPHDQLIELSEASEIDLFRAGAAAARADVLLFTEAHCLAAPDAVEILLRHLSAPLAVAAQLGGAPLVPNDFARFESRLLIENRDQYPEDAWRRLSLRGLAVRTSVFRAVGGFEVGCGRFAEAILGVRLQRRGLPVEVCDAARVAHANCARPRDLAAALRPGGHGQAVWRERCEQGLEAEFLPPLPDWSDRARWRRPLARHALRLGVGSRRRRSPRALMAALTGAVLGPAAPRLLAAVRAAACLFLCRVVPGEERRYRAYRRASSELLRWGVLEYAAASPLPAAPLAPIAPAELLPARLPDGVFAGFYLAERWRAGDSEPSCRWTRPVAMLRFSAAAADYRLRLRAELPVGCAPDDVGVWLNGHRARREPDGAYRLERRWFRQHGDQLLGITAPPFHPARHGFDDSRELGIALFGVSFER
jgi:hypothetical protein